MRKALVTGASRGIGYAIAKKLAQNGDKIVITGRKKETLERVAKEIGQNVFPMVWDAAEFDKADEKVREAAGQLGGLDIVVNNAGIFARRSEWGVLAGISGLPEGNRAAALCGGAVQNVRDVSWRAAFGLCKGCAGGAGHGNSGGYSLGRKFRAAGRDAQRKRGFSAVIPG